MTCPTAQALPTSRRCLDELKAQGFAGNISIEYEYNWDNSTPEVGQCIGFVRGYGTARKW